MLETFSLQLRKLGRHFLEHPEVEHCVLLDLKLEMGVEQEAASKEILRHRQVYGCLRR